MTPILRLRFVLIALISLSGCAARVRYDVRAVRGEDRLKSKVVVATIIDGRGYSTPLIDDHDVSRDLHDLRVSVRAHAQALGLETAGNAEDPPDTNAVRRILGEAERQHADAVIFLRLRKTAYGGFYASLHRTGDALMSLFWLGVVPGVIGSILDGVPSSQQSASSVIEAFAVSPASQTIIAQATADKRLQRAVAAYSFNPASELKNALRLACDDLLRRMVAAVSERQPKNEPVPLPIDRLVLGQKI
jgi:hypothetical protein